MVPFKIGCMPTKLRNNVDFPTPLAPTTPINSPFFRLNVIFSATRTDFFLLKYPTDTSVAHKIGCVFSAAIKKVIFVFEPIAKSQRVRPVAM